MGGPKELHPEIKSTRVEEGRRPERGDPNVESLGAVEQSRAPAEEARREDRPGCHSGPDGAQQVCVGRWGRERWGVVGVLLVGGGAF